MNFFFKIYMLLNRHFVYNIYLTAYQLEYYEKYKEIYFDPLETEI